MTLLAVIVDTSKRVTDTSSRSAKVRELAATLRALGRDELAIGAAYLAGELPQGRIGIGYAILQSARSDGVVTPVLTLADADAALNAMASIRGSGAAMRRTSALDDLFARATRAEQQFLTRLVMGELRQGALGGVMIDAIASAAKLPPDVVRRAAMYSEALHTVASIAMSEGAAGLAKLQLKTLSPIAPMLAQTAESVTEAFELLGPEVAFEWKVDGARVQVHKAQDEVRVYTRNLNDVSAAVPEVVEAVRALEAREIVLDGETVALQPDGRPRPFQVTMRRFGRKLDVAALRAELPLHVYFFDCLRLDGLSLADRPSRQRFAALAQAVPQALRVPQIVTSSSEEAQSFYERALAAGHEGVMAKALDAPYEAGNRGASWLKIKRAHTLDLLVLAAEWGHGRRTGKLSNLHLGAIDPAGGEPVMLGKTFKGLTDALLAWQTTEFLAREVRRDQWTVYVRPELVVEIAFNDIQASSQYPGGYALRFARVKRYRPDKKASEADTMELIRKLYDAQSR
jgi:DNA ligase-1